jgi:complex III assembly factor LYRM7
MLVAARHAARQAFDKDKHLPPGSEEATKKLHYAQEVARVLRQNVLQGRAAEENPSTYSTVN